MKENSPSDTTFVLSFQAIGELMNYLDSNLLTLNNNLLRANFDRILDSIWVEVLEEIQDVLSKEDPVRSTVTSSESVTKISNPSSGKKLRRSSRQKNFPTTYTLVLQKSTAFYERLYSALDILVDFFHANDKGLPINQIRCPKYEVRLTVALHFMVKV